MINKALIRLYVVSQCGSAHPQRYLYYSFPGLISVSQDKAGSSGVEPWIKFALGLEAYIQFCALPQLSHAVIEINVYFNGVSVVLTMKSEYIYFSASLFLKPAMDNNLQVQQIWESSQFRDSTKIFVGLVQLFEAVCWDAEVMVSPAHHGHFSKLEVGWSDWGHISNGENSAIFLHKPPAFSSLQFPHNSSLQALFHSVTNYLALVC